MRNLQLTKNKQSGVVLIISLIILTVLTAIGVTSMQNSSLELKMISSAHDRNVAFEAAETALTRIEEEITTSPPQLEHLYNNCNGNKCFNSACNSGLCFAGEFNNAFEKSHCYISDPDTTDRKDFWKDPAIDVWNNSGKHQTMTISGLRDPVKYIVEFLCFINAGHQLGTGFSTQGASIDNSENENYKPLYRITAMANGNANRSTVVLQSTYRVNSDL